MNQPALSFRTLTCRPSAFVPLAMSLLGLVVVLLGPAIFHDRYAADEGPTAHIWQLLMAGQLPVLAFFLFQGLRRSIRSTLQVFAVQAGAVAANLAAVFFFT